MEAAAVAEALVAAVALVEARAEHWEKVCIASIRRHESLAPIPRRLLRCKKLRSW